ncbi:MAG: hypothetical protein DI538_30690, partial [Azospira oryzae]
MSAWISWLGDGIRRGATPLLREKVPMLHHLAEFESALLLHQLSLNKYFANSISRERFVMLERGTRRDMEAHLAFLERQPEHGEGVAKVRRAFDEVLALTPRFNAVADSGAADRIEAVLYELNARTNEIRTRVDLLQRD